jgi:predicted transcriptional regulator
MESTTEKLTNAERFLNAYAEIERKLNEMARESRYIPFGQLLSRCAKINRAVSINEASLRQYNELRNAIVHERGKDSEIIAEPTDSATEDIERISELLTQDENIMEFASKPVRTVKPQTEIIDAFREMDKLGTSKIPVYESGRYCGVLTIEEIARWGLEGDRRSSQVTDILKEKRNERVLFLKKNTDVDVAIRGFESSMNHGISLLAVIITEKGNKDEQPIGIITVADLPKILARLS